MEPGEEPRNRVAAANEETQKAASATRVSLSTIVIAALIAVVVLGWLFVR